MKLPIYQVDAMTFEAVPSHTKFMMPDTLFKNGVKRLPQKLWRHMDNNKTLLVKTLKKIKNILNFCDT
jgi:hypothetical protein